METGMQTPPPQKSAEEENIASFEKSMPVHSKPTTSQESFFENLVSRFSSAVSVPLAFFQSRPEIRTWGEANVEDPSVQPRPKNAPTNYGTGLPGYPKHSCAHLGGPLGRPQGAPEFVSLFTLLGVHDKKCPGPRLDGFPKCKLEYPSLPTDNLGTPSYDYRDLLGYRMDSLPYTNAIMSPQDPTRMYVYANWMVGYPYGVPAVEENERAHGSVA